MNALKALHEDGPHTEQLGAFGGPVATGTGPVLLARDDDERSIREIL